MRDILGLVASAYGSDASIAPENGYCDPNLNPYGCSSGSGGAAPDSSILSPGGLNTAIPLYVPLDVSSSGPSINTTADAPIANNLPTSSPGPLVNVSTNLPLATTPVNPMLVIKSNPWLTGLLVGTGIFLITRKKKRGKR
jgi:hypothetical protein